MLSLLCVLLTMVPGTSERPLTQQGCSETVPQRPSAGKQDERTACTSNGCLVGWVGRFSYFQPVHSTCSVRLKHSKVRAGREPSPGRQQLCCVWFFVVFLFPYWPGEDLAFAFLNSNNNSSCFWHGNLCLPQFPALGGLWSEFCLKDLYTESAITA